MLPAADLYVGAKTVDITPDGPVLLAGRLYARVAKTVHSPIEANIIELGEPRGDKVPDSAILVAPTTPPRPPRARSSKDNIQKAIPDFDISKRSPGSKWTTPMPASTLSHSAAEETEDVIGHAELVRMVTDKITQGVKGAVGWPPEGEILLRFWPRSSGTIAARSTRDAPQVMYGKTNTPTPRRRRD